MGSQSSKPEASSSSSSVSDVTPDQLTSSKGIPLDINVPHSSAMDASHADEALGEVADVSSPVSMEHFHTRAKDIFPTTFQGARFAIHKPFSQNFQASHTLVIDGKESAYRFGVTYVGTQRVTGGDVFPVMTGELSGKGNLQAQIVHQFMENWKTRYMVQMNPQSVSQQQLTHEWTKGRWLAGFTIANPSADLSRFISVMDTSCQLTDQVCTTNQFVLQASPVIPGGIVGSWSTGIRITSSHKVPLSDAPWGAGARPHRTKEQSKWQVAVTGSPLSLSLNTSFAMRITSQLQVATELELNARQQAATASIGYQYDLPQASTTIKSSVDQDLNVQTTLERRMLPLPFLVTLSARGNPFTNKFAIGVGLSTE